MGSTDTAGVVLSPKADRGAVDDLFDAIAPE